MTRTLWTFAAAAVLAACGKPLETKGELATAVAGASVASAASRGVMAGTSGGQQTLAVPFLTVRGSHGGEATLSINPLGAAIGLVGQGVLFDVEYGDYSADGLNYLYGQMSVLANFDYVSASGEDPEANFEMSFVGTMGITGAVRDEARVNLRIKTNLLGLTDGAEQLTLRLDGSVHANDVDLDFANEDVVIGW